MNYSNCTSKMVANFVKMEMSLENGSKLSENGKEWEMNSENGNELWKWKWEQTEGELNF